MCLFLLRDRSSATETHDCDHVFLLPLQSGVSLSSRNIISMLVILYATMSVNSLGATALAAHEILRQVS